MALLLLAGMAMSGDHSPAAAESTSALARLARQRDNRAAFAQSAQSGRSFAGTWVLNQDKSTFDPLTNRPDRRVITLQIKGDELTHTTETERTVITPVEPFQEISTTRVTYSARFDGREYQVPNSNARVRLKRIDPTTFERVASTGKANETARWSLSADANVLTVTTKGLDEYGVTYSSLQVYERR